ncbi:hypothetical protein [Nocardioides dongkuii]|uniref:hypothetical protein n=1 Tax=Nocardioides dongkuii TaxID=2760089 RepID=UPI0015F8FDBB|nr:hypothetical protein [Nocardioides dongkuii]
MVAILTVVLALRLWSVSRWSWMYDDWVYMQEARSMGFVDFLFQNYNGHLMPGEFLVVWVTTRVAPLSHIAVVILTALAATAATAVWAVALRELCGERLRTLVPLALIALTPLHLQGTIWWAAALQTIPLQATLAGCVYFAARLARHGRRADRIGLLLVYVAGLAMWEKALLVAIPIAAVIIYLAPRRPGRWRGLIREGCLLGGVATGYAAIYLVATRRDSTGPFPVEFKLQPAGAVAGSFGELGGHLLSPGLLGGPWGTLPTEAELQAHPAGWQVVLTCAVVVLGLALASILRRSAWVPLGMVALFGSISWGLLALSGRLEVLGLTKLGYERYAADIFAVLCLAVALWMTPEAVRPVADREHWRARLLSRRPPRALAVGIVGAVMVSLAVANLVGVHRIGVSPAQAWLENVTAEVEQRGPVTIVDAYAPDPVLFAPFFGEYARLSRMLEPLGDRVRFDGPADRLFTVDADGRLREATILPAIRSKPGPVPDCGYALGPGERLVVPMTASLYQSSWMVQVNAFSSMEGGVVVELGEHALPFAIRPGLNSPRAMVLSDTDDEIRIESTAEEGVLCVTHVLIGTVGGGPG